MAGQQSRRLAAFAFFEYMATNVYIDGFNLYYGSLKRRWPQYKWLDLERFCQGLLPGRDINRIRYFTARVFNSPRTHGVFQRQTTYLRALETLQSVMVHFGQFRVHDVWMPLSEPPYDVVKVQRTEEKGSDVNLAAYLLLDCFAEEFDEAVVISNDSDLESPIRMVRDCFAKDVLVINPHPKSKQSSRLRDAASSDYQSINQRHFRNNQLPPEISDAQGTFTKPPEW